MIVPLRVLIAEDSEDAAALIVLELRRGSFQPDYRRVESVDAMCRALEEGNWDLVIADNVIPGLGELEAIRLAHQVDPDLPVIVVSGTVGEELVVGAMRAGASDYLVKDRLIRLVPAVQRELTEARRRRERRHIQEALQESEERYRRLVDLSPEGILVVVVDGKVVFANPAAAVIFGFDGPHRLHGHVASDLIHPDYRDLVAERHKSLLTHELHVPRIEVKLMRQDGTVVDVEVAAGRVTYRNQTGVQLLIHDITERRRAEQSLQQTTRELAKRIKELNCLYSAYSLMTNHDVPLEQRLSNLVRILFAGWQYPEIACARLELAGREYTTDNWHDTSWKLTSRIEAHGQDVGTVQLCYLEQRPEADEGPFLKEERGLIDNVARLLGEVMEHRFADRALEESNALLEKVFATLHLLVAYMDADFNIIRVNRAYAEADGRDPSYFVGKNHFVLYPQPENEGLFRRVVQTGEPHFAFEKRFEYSDHPERGTTYWDWSLQPVTDVNGEVTGLVLCLLDVTERHQAQVALRESEARYRMLMEQAAEGIVIYDRQGLVIDANTQFCRMLGYEREEILGKAMAGFFAEAERVSKPITFGELLSGQTVLRQRSLTRKDGTPVSVESSSKMLPDGRMQAIIRDISERKANEERLAVYQSQLQTMASELSLAEERQRRQIASDLHDRIGQTLAVCNMKLGALRPTVKDRALAEALEEVRSLVHQSIQEVRSLTFEVSPPILYDLGFEPAVEWLAEECQRRHGLVCEFCDDGREKPLHDNMRVVLFQAIRELLFNVIKHARATRAKVTVGRKGDRVRIEVEDDGEGFDLSKLHGRGDGGFGLFSVRERLGYMRGQVEIESAPGKGTRVTLTAPLDIRTE